MTLILIGSSAFFWRVQAPKKGTNRFQVYSTYIQNRMKSRITIAGTPYRPASATPWPFDQNASSFFFPSENWKIPFENALDGGDAALQNEVYEIGFFFNGIIQ